MNLSGAVHTQLLQLTKSLRASKTLLKLNILNILKPFLYPLKRIYKSRFKSFYNLHEFPEGGTFT
jgi:hypothetical protein